MSELEFKWDGNLIAGSLLCFVGGALCSGGGIGGGAFYLSAFMLIIGMDAHLAVPMSKVTIFGVAIGGLFILLPQRHPKSPRRPLVDFDAALTLQPGVLCNGYEPYYWTSGSQAEVDFIIRKGDGIIPIEVKSTTNVTSKSLNVYMQKFAPEYAIRISAKNFGFKNQIKSVPLYAAWCV